MTSWVKVRSYSFPYEAQIAKSRLNSVGMPVYLDNEHTINMDWTYSNALGQVGVYVHEPYFSNAQYLLETDFSEDVDVELGLEKNQCPNCGSNKLSAYTKKKKLAFISFLIIGIPIICVQHGYLCRDCFTFIDLLEK